MLLTIRRARWYLMGMSVPAIYFNGREGPQKVASIAIHEPSH